MNPDLFHILITLGSFIAMEGVAWFTHKYVMHGILWHLHEDHHNKQTKGFFEHNDYFFLFFALPGSVGIILGSLADFNLYFWIGLGITLYGFAYFTVHDIFIHQRFKIFRNSNSKYFYYPGYFFCNGICCLVYPQVRDAWIYVGLARESPQA